MLRIPLPGGGEFAVIEPGNIARLKEGKPMHVGNCLVAFTPDMERFMQLLGADGSLPPKGKLRLEHGYWTPEQIEAALQACQRLPEVVR